MNSILKFILSIDKKLSKKGNKRTLYSRYKVRKQMKEDIWNQHVIAMQYALDKEHLSPTEFKSKYGKN